MTLARKLANFVGVFARIVHLPRLNNCPKNKRTRNLLGDSRQALENYCFSDAGLAFGADAGFERAATGGKISSVVLMESSCGKPLSR